MQAKNDISDELRSLSALVAGIGRQMPYELPEGYFEGLPPLILGEVLNRIAGLNHGDICIKFPKSLTFSVPEGYFDNFASQVLGRIKAGSAQAGRGFVGGERREELARLSPSLAGSPGKTLTGCRKAILQKYRLYCPY
jgi:hypothetical protein